MAESLPATVDVLQLAAGETASRVRWIQGKIADECYVPQAPPKPWAGRDEIAQATADHFDLDILEGYRAVDLAAADLWAMDKDDGAHVAKQAMLLRYVQYRKLILRAIREGRKETTSEIVVQPDPQHPGDRSRDKLVRVPVKEKAYSGVDMSAVGRLLEVENAIAELQGLKGRESGTNMALVQAAFDDLDKLAEKEKKKRTRVVGSVVHSVAAKGEKDLNEAGKGAFVAMLEDLTKGGKAPEDIEEESGAEDD